MISFQYMLNNAPTNDWYGRKPFDMPYNNVTHRKCTHSESATQKEETVNEHDRHRELTKSHTNTRTHTQIHSHAMHTDASMRTRFVHLNRMGKKERHQAISTFCVFILNSILLLTCKLKRIHRKNCNANSKSQRVKWLIRRNESERVTVR